MTFCHHQSVRNGIVWRHRSIAGCTANGVSLVLPIVRRRPNTKALHLVKQCRALQAESGGRSARTSELPIGALASNEDLSTHLIFKRPIRNLWLQRLASLEWPWFKDALIGENDAARDVVLQLSNVTGPVVANQGAHGFLRDGFDGFVHGVCELLNEVFHQLGDIRFPFAQRRKINRKSIQAVVQIFAEFAVANHLFQVLVGCSNDANIDSCCACTADRLKLTLLEHAEQLGLKLEWHVSNFIEEQSAVIRQREAADMRIDGARKGSTFVSEELAFEKAGGHRRAVHLDQISVSTGAELVNRSRDDFLACAGLSGNQDGCVRAGHGLQLIENGAQAAAAPYDRVQERGFRAFWLARRPFVTTIVNAIHRRAFGIGSSLDDRV